MTDRISFAQFILNDIAANGAYIGWAWGMESDYTPITRLSLDNRKNSPMGTIGTRTDKDDWAYEAGWSLFGYNARICRGTEDNLFHMTVRGKLAFELLLIQDAFFTERKAKRVEAKAIAKQKKLDARWWP